MMTHLRPALQGLIVLFGVLLVLELAFHLAAAPNLRLTKLVMAGDRPPAGSTAADLLGLRKGDYYFSVDEAAVKSRLLSKPWVRTAEVKKKFPDTLAVDLKARQPLALCLVGGAVLPVDEEGVVFDVRTDAQGLDLPVISGVAFESLQAGSRFPDTVKPLFTRLAALKAEAPGLFRQISEVQLRKNDRGGFDALIYPAGTPVRVILGDRWDRATVEQMFVLLDLVRQQGWAGKTKEIDFRATPVVLRPRES